MGRVRIGVTCSAADGVASRIEKVGRGYLDGLARAGGLPVVLPSLDAGWADDAVDGIDALVLTGGGDVEPSRYGATPEPETGEPDLPRDAWELGLVAAARARSLPVLGICRGAQVLNVAYGGTLVQHLAHRTSAEHDDLDRAGDEVHEIAVADGSRLRSIVGEAVVRVNTLHHQSVDEVGAGLVVVGRAEDGTIEAIESATEPVVGVQWHPELLLDRANHQALFDWIVADAAVRG